MTTIHPAYVSMVFRDFRKLDEKPAAEKRPRLVLFVECL
jgi:hypothetical protein